PRLLIPEHSRSAHDRGLRYWGASGKLLSHRRLGLLQFSWGADGSSRLQFPQLRWLLGGGDLVASWPRWDERPPDPPHRSDVADDGHRSKPSARDHRLRQDRRRQLLCLRYVLAERFADLTICLRDSGDVFQRRDVVHAD